jgi:hypothetical protein
MKATTSNSSARVICRKSKYVVQDMVGETDQSEYLESKVEQYLSRTEVAQPHTETTKCPCKPVQEPSEPTYDTYIRERRSRC